MDEVQHITTGVMRLVVLYHICPSKVRAYNSKGELKILMYVLLLVCNLTCRYMFWGRV